MEPSALMNVTQEQVWKLKHNIYLKS